MTLLLFSQPDVVTYDSIRIIEIATGMNIFFVEDQKLAKVPNATSLRVHQQNHDIHPNIPTLPRDEYSQSRLPPDGEKLRKIFNTQARCAVYMAPHYGIRISSQMNRIYDLPFEGVNGENIEDMPDTQLYSAVVDAVQLPPCIVVTADTYIREAMNGNKFVGVHWRYDKHDWKALYCKQKKIYQTFCDDLELITFEDIASAIINTVQASCEKKIRTDAQIFIYIAVPPSLKEFKENLLRILPLLNSNFVRPSVDLASFLTRNFQTCWKSGKWAETEETLSLLEMQVMAESEWFFYSRLSSWSDVIRHKRARKQNGQNKKNFEASVYQSSRTQMLHRRNRK